MAEETIMVLKVDLGCSRCYKKVKKLLCKYSEIRDQVFYDKEDTVIIKVVCCNPERIRSKLICKSDGAIKSIEIRKPPEKPKPEKPPEQPKVEKPPDKPKAEKPPEKPKAEKPPEKPKAEKPPEQPKAEKPPEQPKAEKPAEKPKAEKPAEKPKAEKPPEQPKAEKPPEKPKAEKPPEQPKNDKPPPKEPQTAPAPAPVAGYPQFFPVAVCCKPCYDMGHGGPCQHGYGVPYQPPPQPSSYDGYVRLLPSYNEPSYGGGWSSGCQCNRSYGCRCHCEYFTEENPSCTIM